MMLLFSVCSLVGYFKLCCMKAFDSFSHIGSVLNHSVFPREGSKPLYLLHCRIQLSREVYSSVEHSLN